MSNRPIRAVIADRAVVTAQTTTTVTEAAVLMKKHRTSALLVCDKRRLAGVFTERDALFRVIAEKRDPHTTVLADVMTRNPQTITSDRPLGHAMHLMYEGRFRHVPVVERGIPIGMVSASDALGPELREFVAEIDEREHIAEILG
jgi:CBS domain-containing protein